MSTSSTFASRLFCLIGSVASKLPSVRGKNRAFLSLFDALGLRDRHTFVETVLQAPTRYRVRLDLHSWLQRIAYISGEYESDTVRFLIRLKDQRRGYLLDVGANIGLISIPAALLISDEVSERVVAVEAVPDNAAALRRNVALNSLQDVVRVIGTALGESTGSVEIYVEGNLRAGEGTGTANIIAAGSEYPCERIAIPVSTLDTLFTDGHLSAGCAVVKIDTDGYDLKVLQGGREFLAAARPTIYGEFAAFCMNWHGQTVYDVVAFAKGIDYVVWQRVPGKGFQFSSQIVPELFVQDLLFVPTERMTELQWCLQDLPADLES